MPEEGEVKDRFDKAIIPAVLILGIILLVLAGLAEGQQKPPLTATQVAELYGEPQWPPQPGHPQLPRRIVDCSGHVYDVMLTDSLRGTGSAAQTFPPEDGSQSPFLWLRRDMPLWLEAEVFLHELGHVAFRCQQSKLPEAGTVAWSEETALDRLERPWLELLIQNPDLQRWLAEVSPLIEPSRKEWEAAHPGQKAEIAMRPPKQPKKARKETR